MILSRLVQGVSYSQKFRSKCGFPNLAMVELPNLRSQIINRVPKCKNNESKFKSEKSKKNKHKRNVVLKENKTERH